MYFLKRVPHYFLKRVPHYVDITILVQRHNTFRRLQSSEFQRCAFAEPHSVQTGTRDLSIDGPVVFESGNGVVRCPEGSANTGHLKIWRFFQDTLHVQPLRRHGPLLLLGFGPWMPTERHARAQLSPRTLTERGGPPPLVGTFPALRR